METDQAIALHDELLADQPAGARHDTDICPICVDKASQKETHRPGSLPASAGPDESKQHQTPTTEGGTTEPMSDNAGTTISQETHTALLKQAVSDATSTTDKALQDATTTITELSAKLEKSETELASVRAEEARLNGELDKAQVELKTANDKASQLETDLAKVQEESAKAEIASKRAEQVKNLGLFEDDKIAERASKWAELDEASWDDKVAEWQLLKPAAPGTTTTDSASALSGTTESLTKTGAETGTDAASDSTTSPRRLALGLA